MAWEKRTERIVVRVSPSMLKVVAELADAKDLKPADWAFRLVKHEVDRAQKRRRR